MFTRKLEKLIKVEKDHKLHSVNSFVLFNPVQTGGGGGAAEAKHLQTEKQCIALGTETLRTQPHV